MCRQLIEQLTIWVASYGRTIGHARCV
eukprot:SAG11_NODE_26100_length_349_cov_6.584000_1_plen_26_part_01